MYSVKKGVWVDSPATGTGIESLAGGRPGNPGCDGGRRSRGSRWSLRGPLMVCLFLVPSLSCTTMKAAGGLCMTSGVLAVAKTDVSFGETSPGGGPWIQLESESGGGLTFGGRIDFLAVTVPAYANLSGRNEYRILPRIMVAAGVSPDIGSFEWASSLGVAYGGVDAFPYPYYSTQLRWWSDYRRDFGLLFGITGISVLPSPATFWASVGMTLDAGLIFSWK